MGNKARARVKAKNLAKIRVKVSPISMKAALENISLLVQKKLYYK